ncbi:MAG: hypothetical protein ACE5FN_08605 [Leptospirillia bacterium]
MNNFNMGNGACTVSALSGADVTIVYGAICVLEHEVAAAACARWIFRSGSPAPATATTGGQQKESHQGGNGQTTAPQLFPGYVA